METKGTCVYLFSNAQKGDSYQDLPELSCHTGMATLHWVLLRSRTQRKFKSFWSISWRWGASEGENFIHWLAILWMLYPVKARKCIIDIILHLTYTGTFIFWKQTKMFYNKYIKERKAKKIPSPNKSRKNFSERG